MDTNQNTHSVEKQSVFDSAYSDVINQDRRKEPRLRANSLAVVRSADPLGAPFKVFFTVVDISVRGLQLNMGTRLSPGTTVHLLLKAKFFTGEIRDCRPAHEGFDHGVSLQEQITIPQGVLATDSLE